MEETEVKVIFVFLGVARLRKLGLPAPGRMTDRLTIVVALGG